MTVALDTPRRKPPAPHSGLRTLAIMALMCAAAVLIVWLLGG